MAEGVILLISGIIAAIGIGISVALAQKAQNVSMPEDLVDLGEFEVTRQAEGLPIPIVYGVCWLTGNIVWWDSIKNNDDYYSFAFWQVICMGQVKLLNVYKDGASPRKVRITDIYTSEYLEFSQVDRILNNLLEVKISATPPADPYFVYYYKFYNGTLFQSNQPSHISYEWPERLPNNGTYFSTMRGIASLWSDWVDLNQFETRIPTYKYIVERVPNIDLSGEGSAHIIYANIEDHDNRIVGANPAFVYYDLLVNEYYNLGIDTSKIDKDNFDQAAIYFESLKYGINLPIKPIVSVRDIITKLQFWTNSYLVKNDQDEYQIKILKETDADIPVGTITDEDVIKF